MINQRQTVASSWVSSPNSVAQLRDVIARLISLVSDENKMLDSRRDESLDQFIQKKSQLLLELMRAQKHFQPELMKDHLKGDLVKLQRALAENGRKLAIHYAAAKEVTDVILGVLRENESDGTYLCSPNSQKSYQ